MTNTDRKPFPFTSVGITGGTGTVAGPLMEYMVQCPNVERILTTIRNPDSDRGREVAASSPRIDVIKASIADLNALRRLADETAIVYHLAAWLANTALPEDRNEVYIVNGLATAVLGKLCRDQGKKMVFTSSHSVYFAGPYQGRIQEDFFPFRNDFVEWIDAVKGAYYALSEEILAGTASLSNASAHIDAIHADLPPPFDPLIYDKEEYHIYCLSKLLAETFALDMGGLVLRLSNVYGPGDASMQAVGEACHRIVHADPQVETKIRQPFKKLVPACLVDIVNALIRSADVNLPEGVPPVFTVASQETYLKEDELLRTMAGALNAIRGTDTAYAIEQLEPDPVQAFTYDLTKLRKILLPDVPLTPFDQGLEAALRWRMDRGIA